MSVGYDGIKFHDVNDLSCWYYLERTEPILDEFNEYKQYTDINQVIELFNIKQFFENELFLKSWDEEKIVIYEEKAAKFPAIIGRFFAKINNYNFLNFYNNLGNIYHEDFWILFDKFRLYQRIDKEVILCLLQEEPHYIRFIFEHKLVVHAYSDIIYDFMLKNVHSIEYVMDYYLSDYDKKYFFPEQLNEDSINNLLLRYLDSGDVNLNYLRLVFEAQRNKDFPVNDLVKLNARKKYNKYWEEHFKNNEGIRTTVTVQTGDLDSDVKKFQKEGLDFKVIFDKNWLTSNLDYRTILNNFIFVFGFTDFECRCDFLAKKSELSILERTLGIRGKNDYLVGSAFKTNRNITNLSMRFYYHTLIKEGIYLEEVIKWFFEEYLKEEFGINGFVFNPSSKETKFLEKHKNLTSEMEGVLKQFELFCKHNEVNRELLEISSSAVVYSEIPSLIKKKYLYANCDDLTYEMNLWFSDQATLSYTDKVGSKYHMLYDLIKNEEMKMDDFLEFQCNRLKWLCERGSLSESRGGILFRNINRSDLLYHLYQNEVVCPSYHSGWDKIIKDLLANDEVKFESKLFSRPEADYINFMLNKSKFSNGFDLRNKYSHGTYPNDEDEQKDDYMELLKIMILIVIKINEEFCLKFPSKEVNVRFI